MLAEKAAAEIPNLTEFFPIEQFLSGSAPLEFFRIHGQRMGQKVRVRRIAKFYDTSSWFRFFKQLDEMSAREKSTRIDGETMPIQTTLEGHASQYVQPTATGINQRGPEKRLVEKLYAQLLDGDAKKEAISLMRDRFLGRVLDKKSVSGPCRITCLPRESWKPASKH